MDKVLNIKRNIIPLITSYNQRKIFEESNIILNKEYTLFDYLYDNKYLDKTIDGHDNLNQCLNILGYLLTNNDDKTFNCFMEKLIIKECNYLLNLVIKYFFIDRSLVLKLVHLYKNKKSISNQQLKYMVEKRENKSWKYKNFYKTALLNDNYKALGILLDYNHDEDIIDYLNDFNIFRQLKLKDKKKINYEKIKIIIDEGRLDILKILVSNGLDVTFCDRFNNPPLIYAIRAEQYDIVDFLTDYYTKIPKLPLQDLSNLISHGKLDILQILLRGKINIKLLNFKGKYDLKEILLKEALISGNEEIVEYLKSCGISNRYLCKLYENNDILKNAIISENINLLKIFMDNEIDLNSKDKNGYSALNYAIKYRKINTLKFLMGIKVDISTIHYQILTDIMNGELDILKFLIDNSIELNFEEANTSSLIFTINNNEKDSENQNISQLIEFLISCGANIQTDYDNNIIKIEDGILHKDNLDLLKNLISSCDMLNNGYDDNTILKSVFKSGRLELVKFLTEDGAKISIVNQNIALVKPLIEYNQLDILNYLISNNLSINSTDSDNNTPLIYSIQSNNIEIMECLINNGANVNVVNNEIIKDIIHCNKFDILKFLVINHLNIHDTNKFGDIPLKYAIDEGKYDIINYLIINNVDIQFLYHDCSYINKLVDITIKNTNKLDLFENLIARDFNINYEDNDGCTALIYSIQKENVNLIKYLLNNGADIQVVNKKIHVIDRLILNCMDFMELERNKLFTLLDVLIDNNLDINMKDEKGNTLLFYATNKNKHKEIINYLKMHGALE